MRFYAYLSYLILLLIFAAAIGIITYDFQRTSKLLEELNSEPMEFKRTPKMQNDLNQKNKMPESTPLIYYKNGSRRENKIALTFDDGPSPYFTPQVLDILARHNTRATFFVLGKWAEQYPDIIKRMKDERHLVGNHGYSHDKGIGDFKKSEEILLKILGDRPEFLRPPYGELKLLDKETFLAKKIILWDVEARDWERPKPEVIVERILSTAKNGSIILLHDGSRKDDEQKERPQNMVLALSKIIEKLQKKFQLVRVDELDLISSHP